VPVVAEELLKSPVVPLPKPDVVVGVLPKPVVAGLAPPNSEPPPNPLVPVVLLAVLEPKPPLPNPVLPAVAVVDAPKRPPPLLVVAVPNGLAAPNPPAEPKPPPVLGEPNAAVDEPNRPPPVVPVVLPAPKPLVPAPNPRVIVSHQFQKRGESRESGRNIKGVTCLR